SLGHRRNIPWLRWVQLPAPQAQVDRLAAAETLQSISFAADFDLQGFIGGPSGGAQLQPHDRTDDAHREHRGRPAAGIAADLDFVRPDQRDVAPARGGSTRRYIHGPEIDTAVAP